MRFLAAFFMDTIIIGSLYFGLAIGSSGLINIGYFAGWLFGSLTLLALLMTKTKEEMAGKYKHQIWIWRVYDALTDIAYVAFAAYSGWFVLAVVYAIASIGKAQFKADQEKRLAACRI